MFWSKPKIKQLSYEDVTKDIQALIEKYGYEHKYENLDEPGTPFCKYQHNKPGPGCIVGEVLLRHGVDRKWLQKVNGHFHGLLLRLGDEFHLTFTDKATMYLATVQRKQDSASMRATWGAADRYAQDIVRDNNFDQSEALT